MSKQRIEHKKERLKMYYKAEKKILNGQSYMLGTRRLTRTDLAHVQSKIEELEAEIEMLEKHGTTGRRAVRVIPLD